MDHLRVKLYTKEDKIRLSNSFDETFKHDAINFEHKLKEIMNEIETGEISSFTPPPETNGDFAPPINDFSDVVISSDDELF